MIPLMVISGVFGLAPNGLLGKDFPDLNNSWKKDRLKILSIIFILVVSISSFEVVSARNRVITQDRLMKEFSEFNLVVKEIDRSRSRIHSGNLTEFKEILSYLNITTVYVEPYNVDSRYLKFYYERNGVQWQCDIELRVSMFGTYTIN